jgi:hypothetical protein
MTSIDDAAAEALKRSFLLGTMRNPVPIGAALKAANSRRSLS